MPKIYGAEVRRWERREHQRKEAWATVSERTFDVSVEELWNAITTPERLARWFSPVEGDFRPGGRYRIQGNAEGTIESCDAPEALDLTWEFAGTTTWVRVRVAAAGTRAMAERTIAFYTGG